MLSRDGRQLADSVADDSAFLTAVVGDAVSVAFVVDGNSSTLMLFCCYFFLCGGVSF